MRLWDRRRGVGPWSSAQRNQAAIDQQRVPGDVAGLVGEQERGGVGDLPGGALAPERDRGAPRVLGSALLARRPSEVSISPGTTRLTRMSRAAACLASHMHRPSRAAFEEW